MKKLLDILNQTPEAILEAAAVASDLGVNSNQVVPPITASENDRVGVALQKLDQIGEMVDDLYNTLSHLEEIDSDIDMSVTSAYNTVDDLYAKIDEKYDVIPIDFDGEEYSDIEESFNLEESLKVPDELLKSDDIVSYIKKNIKGQYKSDVIKVFNEDLELDEKKMSPQQSFDYERYMNGAMKKDDYEKKWKLGKYKPTESNAKKLTGPGGLYKNLVHKSMREELELEESVNLSKIKELVAMSLIDEKDVAPTIAALKAAQSPEKVLTKNQISLLANLSVMLTNVILGDTAALSSVKRAAKE